MRTNVYQLWIVLLLVQSHAADYQFVSASPPLAAQRRMELRSVAVVATSEPAQYGFQKSKGRTGYAADGAGNSARTVLEGGLSSGDSLVAVGSVAWFPVAAVVGAITEGTRKLTPDALGQSEAELTNAMTEMANQSLMRDRLVKIAREKAGRVVSIRDDLAVPMGGSADYRALRGEGVDTVLETTVRDIRLQRTGSRDSSYALFIDSRVRLVRPEDGVVLYDYPLQYHSGTCLFIDWTLNHAEPFKVQVESAYEKLAEKIVERVLLDPAYNTPRLLDSQTLACGKAQERPGNKPVLLAAKTTEGFGSGHFTAANEWMARLGTIGIVSTSTFPTLSIQRPLTKKKASRELGQRFAALGGDEETASAFTAGTLGLGLPITVASGVIGQTAGALGGVPKHKFAMADDALDRAVAESDMQEQLRNQVLRLVREQCGGRVVLVKKPLPEGAGPEFARLSCVRCATLAWLPQGQSAHDYLASQGIDTALEIQILHPGLKGGGGVNPSLVFCTDVRASLIRVRDGRELASVPLKYQSEKHKFTRWAANDAQLFREEIERCNQTLTEKIADEIFGKPLPGTIDEVSRIRLAGSPQLQNKP